jgi:hypothetical protein
VTTLLHALLFVVPAALAGGAAVRLAGHRHTLTARAEKRWNARYHRPLIHPAHRALHRRTA